jgi:hypothetical protein
MVKHVAVPFRVWFNSYCPLLEIVVPQEVIFVAADAKFKKKINEASKNKHLTILNIFTPSSQMFFEKFFN